MKIFSKEKLTDLEREKITEFINDLPHGSGVNGDWFAEVNPRRIILSNCYDAMNDAGMYCHYYDFNLVVNRKDLKILRLKIFGHLYVCCGWDLKNYLEELFLS